MKAWKNELWALGLNVIWGSGKCSTLFLTLPRGKIFPQRTANQIAIIVKTFPTANGGKKGMQNQKLQKSARGENPVHFTQRPVCVVDIRQRHKRNREIKRGVRKR